MTPAKLPMQMPQNLRATGLVLDRGQLGNLDYIIESAKSNQAKRLLETWAALGQFEYAVLCGAIHTKAGGIFGGLAATQEQALLLFATAIARMDGLAKGRGDFTSCWVLLVQHERLAAFQAVAAQAQATAGA